MICDYCGGRLYQRQDDKEETVRKRLEVYRQQAQPLIEYYEKENKFYRINADGPAQEVIDKIIEIVNGAK